MMMLIGDVVVVSTLHGVHVQLLERSPKKRLGSGPEGADEIKKHPFFSNIDWVLLPLFVLLPSALLALIAALKRAYEENPREMCMTYDTCVLPNPNMSSLF